MSNVKERIIGAVTIMSEEEAEKVWNLIQASFILSDVEEIEPDPEEWKHYADMKLASLIINHPSLLKI